MNFTHIELFAGCGGLTLGLQKAGFSLVFANELSPMAGETFAYNLMGEDLWEKAAQGKAAEKVSWIRSNFDTEKLRERLRENPLEDFRGKYTDINPSVDLSDKLIIGDIDHLLKFFNANRNICKHLRGKNIELLSGGPPCQGFSLAGKRMKEDRKNLLPLSFAKFAGLIQPKVVLLENVRGITSPFKTEDGIKHFPWFEVAKAFAFEGFFPICFLVNSKYFGIPQNRPRFILFAFRKDVFEKLRLRKSNSTRTNLMLNNSHAFYNKIYGNHQHRVEIQLSDLALYDIENDIECFDGKLLPKILSRKKDFVTARDAIKDISSTKKRYKLDSINNKYALKLNKIFKPRFNLFIDELQNHDHRNHSYKVKARFRFYQILNNFNGLRQEAIKVIQGNCEDEEVLQNVFQAFKGEALLLESGEKDVFEKPKSIEVFKKYLKEIESKKHSQRAIHADEPASAQMTIPDDLCHYSIEELRTLTVREMARFQSFPDWFVFRSKITTGGQQRSYEVPQYTQVGNAVPPLLAYELGRTISNILNSIE